MSFNRGNEAYASEPDRGEGWIKKECKAYLDEVCDRIGDPVADVNVSIKSHYSRLKLLRQQLVRRMKAPGVFSNDARAFADLFVLAMQLFAYSKAITEHPEYPSLNADEQRSTVLMFEHSVARAQDIKARLRTAVEDKLRRYQTDYFSEQEQVQSNKAEAQKPDVAAPAHENTYNEFLKGLPSVSKPPSEFTTRQPEQESACAIMPSAPPADDQLPSYSEVSQPSQTCMMSKIDPGMCMLRLRQVVLPRDAMHKFMNAAMQNTSNNTETCAVLCADEAGVTDARITVSTVILPPQQGTCDTCEAHGEEEVLNHVISMNLVVVGWIHTHPSQSAFLSSVDMHMTYGYQSTLPEAIAVVMSPTKQPTFGVFRLTTAGMDTIKACRQSGFHSHSIPSEKIFGTCENFLLDESQKVQMMDLR